MTKHNRRPRAAYVALLARKRDEGLTYEELSAASGIPMSTLLYWARKLAAPEEASGAAEPSSFIELDLCDALSSGIELIVPSGARLAIQPGFDAATLRAVVEALSC